ncbi:MAG TPA: chemotaxis protein CheW [Candidatus Solibacter sp.]|nr:chemotaxis protein CheW [Candidatus Solibacter sp.]
MEIKTNGKANSSATNPAKQDQTSGELQLVSFHVGQEEFCLEILRVQEIIRIQQLTRVPNSPDAMDGVMNLRGKIIPVVALRKRFGLERLPYDKQARIVVIEVKGTVLGLIVDSVLEVLRIPADTVEPPPHLGKVRQEYVSGVGKVGDRLLILLDVDRLVNPEGLMSTQPEQDVPELVKE